MKSFAIALAASAALFTSAFAADLPARAPVYKAAPPTAWSWNGFYVGGNVGGGIGRNSSTLSETQFGASFVAATQKVSPAGFIGGGQLGYNYQYAPNWLVGIEGDFQGSTQSDSSCLGTCSSVPGFGSLRVDITQKLEWFATLRARLGYTSGDWLWYVTGGGAWAQVRNDVVGTGTNAVGAVSVSESNGSSTQSGWTVGGGVETHLWSNWTAKAEYLYMDLGSMSSGPLSVSIPATTTVGVSQTTDIRDHIVRVGLNYKFR